MADCEPGTTKTENGTYYVCVGGQWVPLPPTIRIPPGPGATVIVETREQLQALLGSKEITDALQSPRSQLMISIVPVEPDAD
jgi:hypothetical protein